MAHHAVRRAVRGGVGGKSGQSGDRAAVAEALSPALSSSSSVGLSSGKQDTAKSALGPLSDARPLPTLLTCLLLLLQLSLVTRHRLVVKYKSTNEEHVLAAKRFAAAARSIRSTRLEQIVELRTFVVR
ncbi:hypothetical protein MRX96_011737 [Rhipicephalus microplus]